MATKIGQLSAVLSLNAGKFNAGLDKSGKRLSKFGKSIRKHTAGITRFGKMLTLAAVGGTAALIKSQFSAIDSTQKFADRIGASADALVRLELAGKRTGVSVETMRMALQRMTRRVAEAALGTGEAVKALKELGINAKELNSIPLDKKFGRIARAFESIENPADKVRLAMKLFDSEGVSLINTLNLTEAGLIRVGDEAARMSLTFDAAGGRTVEKFNDAMGNLKETMFGVGRILAIDVAQGFKMFNTDLVVSTAGAESLRAKVQEVFSTVVSGIGFAIDVFSVFKGVVLNMAGIFTTAFSGLIAILRGFAAELQTVINLLPGVNVDITSGLVRLLLGSRSVARGLFASGTDSFVSGTIGEGRIGAGRFLQSAIPQPAAAGNNNDVVDAVNTNTQAVNKLTAITRKGLQ